MNRTTRTAALVAAGCLCWLSGFFCWTVFSAAAADVTGYSQTSNSSTAMGNFGYEYFSASYDWGAANGAKIKTVTEKVKALSGSGQASLTVKLCDQSAHCDYSDCETVSLSSTPIDVTFQFTNPTYSVSNGTAYTYSWNSSSCNGTDAVAARAMCSSTSLVANADAGACAGDMYGTMIFDNGVPTCGDDVCEGDETWYSCPLDCGDEFPDLTGMVPDGETYETVSGVVNYTADVDWSGAFPGTYLTDVDFLEGVTGAATWDMTVEMYHDASSAWTEIYRSEGLPFECSEVNGDCWVEKQILPFAGDDATLFRWSARYELDTEDGGFTSAWTSSEYYKDWTPAEAAVNAAVFDPDLIDDGGNWFTRALKWAFVPPEDLTETAVSSAKGILSDTFPFGLFTTFSDQYGNEIAAGLEAQPASSAMVVWLAEGYEGAIDEGQREAVRLIELAFVNAFGLFCVYDRLRALTSPKMTV